ncbi:hypothetical protein C7H83_10205 [Tetragenococcus halophilus]|uniref:Uncharacterized protein n=2 Tax=Tetragenococcus halophilus TaxID=51669 RepID=A0A3G5FKD2_TETHA|nr:hypothetical protein C7H83_10205 [Tetragenococcus halophilus]
MNDHFDIRKYLSIDIDAETKEELEQEILTDIDDIDFILSKAKIYVDGEALDMDLEELKKGRR